MVIRPATSFIHPSCMTHASPITLTPPHPIQSTATPTTQPCSPSTRQGQEDPDLLTTSSSPRPKLTSLGRSISLPTESVWIWEGGHTSRRRTTISWAGCTGGPDLVSWEWGTRWALQGAKRRDATQIWATPNTITAATKCVNSTQKLQRLWPLVLASAFASSAAGNIFLFCLLIQIIPTFEWHSYHYASLSVRTAFTFVKWSMFRSIRGVWGPVSSVHIYMITSNITTAPVLIILFPPIL